MTLKFETLRLRGRRVGASSWVPALRELIKSEISAKLDEDDGLFIGYGMFQDGLPYTLQDSYDTPEEELRFKAAVLENKYLKAVFLPELGGRLWSLRDKENDRDLLLENTRLLPCNLGIRNAWFAGGVEFNCGRRGHDEQTMSPRFCAVVETPEFPVLRIYEYQRDRGTPFQYDSFLPEDSRFLFIRGRIYNPDTTLQPMYWWSNMALPEVPGSRVVVPAMDTFANWYSGGSHALAKLPLPDGEGFDGTYPVNFQYVKDHFYNIPEDVRRYECLFYKDGYGFCHVSTKRLRGRKLFVWGQCQGGRHWNRKLLGPGLDSYIELQGGLARSQQECLPMPPKTAWEWLEGYGSLVMKPEQVHGKWRDAVSAVNAALDEKIPAEQLETMLRETRNSIALKPGKIVVRGSGWGALEELRRGEKLAPQLDFGTPGEDQAPWVELLEKGTMSEVSPRSYQTGDAWFDLLKKAAPSPMTHYHLALGHFRRQDWERAEKELAAAGDPAKSRHLLHAWANVFNRQGKNKEAAEAILRAALLDTSDVSFVKEALKMLLGLEEYEKMFTILGRLSSECAALPLIQMMKAAALAHTGRPDEAEAILMQDGGLDIPDIREGENSTSQLYIFIKTEQARRAGKEIDPKSVEVPFLLDLRMSE
ncbi:MAG: DUF5107 domain-containing protein [Lentisphaeria bacterium]|nr:DUF5107 domain-containing protein [Lentisphaeria bacterium]